MTIQKKKGIAVLKGVDVVHKLTGEDGAAVIGKEGSTVTLSGTIGVESSTGDMVSMFAWREGEINNKITDSEDYIAAAGVANSDLIMAIETGFDGDLATREIQYLAFTASNETDRAVAEGVHNTATNNIAAATETQENSLAAISAALDADRSTHNATIADFESRLSDIDNSAVAENIAEIEALVLAASSSQEGDLSGKVIALNTAISTMVSNREDAESLMSAAISTQVSGRVSQQASLQTLVNAENTAKNSLALSGTAAWGQSKADNQSAYTAGDAALSGLIDAEITSRTTKDTSLSTRLSTAVAAQGQATGSFNPLMTTEETQEAQANTAATNLITAASLAGNVDLLSHTGEGGILTGSVGAEEQNRIAAYSTFADLVDDEYKAVDDSTEAVYLSLRKAVDDEDGTNGGEANRSVADQSIMDNEMTTFQNLVTGSNGHIAALEPRIATEEGLENAAVIATDGLALAQENRLAALQDHDSDTFLEISAMVSTMSGSEATKLSQDVAAVVGALGTLESNRTTGDGDESDYLTNTVIDNRTNDISSMQSLIEDADAALVSDEGEHTTHLAGVKSTLAAEINTYDTTTLSTAESNMTSARKAGDATLSANLSTAISTREDIVFTQASLQEEDDATLSTRLDNLAVSWNGQDMTLSGHLSVGGNLAVSGETKLGVHTTVPAAYVAGPVNGAIFYLDADDDAARVGFEKGHSWYFCENDVWFASPFSTDEVGGGGGAPPPGFSNPQEALDELEIQYNIAVPFLSAHTAGGTAAADAYAQANDPAYADHVEMAMAIDGPMFEALSYLMGGGYQNPADPFPFSGGDVPFAYVQGASDALYAIILAAMGG